MHELLRDIKNYITHLQNEGIYLSIHTAFTESMLPILEYNYHQNPLCLLVKSNNADWEKCIKVHCNETGVHQKERMRTCYAGVTELVCPLSCGGTVCISTNEALNVEKLTAIAKPLCRMIEYFKLLYPDEKLETTENALVNFACQFIRRNFYNPITNQEIAKTCSCSVSTVCHLFKKFHGTSIRQYILDLRFTYAKQLLTTSNLSITALAIKSGFSDYNYFTSKFKKEFGVSPSAYRKTNHS